MVINRSAITDIRECRGLTKSQLAVEAGISLSYLSEIESGRKPGSPAIARQIAEALRCNVTSILCPPMEPAA